MLRPEVAIARKFRKELSFPETLVWQRVRGEAIGAKIRRQHPVGPYVVDFYCAAASLVIEIDGQAHNGAESSFRDSTRDNFMKANGYRVVRFAAADVLRDVDAVVASIGAIVANPLHRPSAVPPPRSGEE